jgi:hypothetical protein
MTQQSRRQLLIKAIHDAAIELATRAAAQYAAPQLDNKKPPKPKPQMLAIGTLDILDLVRLTVPDVTADEVANIIMQSLPYMGARRQ